MSQYDPDVRIFGDEDDLDPGDLVDPDVVYDWIISAQLGA